MLRRVTTTWRIRRLVTVLAGARRFRMTRLVRASTSGSERAAGPWYTSSQGLDEAPSP